MNETPWGDTKEDQMKRTRRTTEQVIAILPEVDGGKSIQDVCREHNISKQSFHRWKAKYGQMDLKDAKRLRELEREPSGAR